MTMPVRIGKASYCSLFISIIIVGSALSVGSVAGIDSAALTM